MDNFERRVWMAAEMLVYGKERKPEEVKKLLQDALTGNQNESLDSYIASVCSPETVFGFSDEFIESEMKKYKMRDYMFFLTTELGDGKKVTPNWCPIETFFGSRRSIHDALCGSYNCSSCKDSATIYALYNTIKEKSRNPEDAEIFKRYFVYFLKSKQLVEVSTTTILEGMTGFEKKEKVKEFSVGDTVIVKSDMVAGQYYNGLMFAKEMEKYKGRKYQITDIFEFSSGQKGYILSDMNAWSWHGLWLEPAV